MFNKISIIGCGLIGSSILRAVEEKKLATKISAYDKSSKVFKLLAKTGILVRKMDVYGIKNSLRITIGKSDENRKLISKMKKILNVK